jgi:hypothetical protein
VTEQLAGDTRPFDLVVVDVVTGSTGEAAPGITRGIPTPPRDARLSTMDRSPGSRTDATHIGGGREVTCATIRRSQALSRTPCEHNCE